MALTYEKSGVDVKKAEELVGWLKKLKTAPSLGKLIAGIGPFASVYKLPENFKKPLIVTSSDGVGTKLEVARMAGDYSTVGVDLVAMNVNDVSCAFAYPVLFLDYYSAGRIEEGVYKQVLKGIVKGCGIAGCALAGGETAEMPGFYASGQIELAGFSVGITSEEILKKVPPVEEGDLIIGFPSSGFHSNGYSFLRKLFFERLSLKIEDPFPGEEKSLKEILLKPTKIYTPLCRHLMSVGGISAFVHVTGGGIPGNLNRVLPKGLSAEIEKRSWKIPRIFKRVQELAECDDLEMFKTFNMGVGFLALVKPGSLKKVERALKGRRFAFRIVGEITRGKGEVNIR